MASSRGSSGPIYTEDNRVENPRISPHAHAHAAASRPSSGGSSAPPDDGSAEMESYALERQEEVDALRRISGHEVGSSAPPATAPSCPPPPSSVYRIHSQSHPG